MASHTTHDTLVSAPNPGRSAAIHHVSSQSDELQKDSKATRKGLEDCLLAILWHCPTEVLLLQLLNEPHHTIPAPASSMTSYVASAPAENDGFPTILKRLRPQSLSHKGKLLTTPHLKTLPQLLVLLLPKRIIIYKSFSISLISFVNSLFTVHCSSLSSSPSTTMTCCSMSLQAANLL